MTKKSPHDPLASNPFKGDLEALKAKLVAEEEARAASEKSKAAPKVPAKRSPQIDVWRPDMDARLYEVAMSGVTPLAPKGGGRVSPNASEVSSGVKKRSPEVRSKQRLAEGGPTLAAEWLPDGTVRGAHRGREFALEALGRFATCEETLDLHGMDVVTATLRVAEFVRTRRVRGMRCVCVVTGYGKSSPDGASVLLDGVVGVLRAPPTSGDIDAFASAPDHLGGRGAILVSLRQ